MTLLSTALEFVNTTKEAIPLPAVASFALIVITTGVVLAGVREAAKRFLELEGAKPILVVSVLVGLVALASDIPGVPRIGLPEVRDYSVPITGVAIIVAGLLAGWGQAGNPIEWYREQGASRQVAIGAVFAVALALAGIGGFNALQANLVGVPAAGLLLVTSILLGAILPRL